jgi:2-polyprenyl-6-hydroxyphenyl methylase/3-demethylubiquinone-9 3-methyltransferase
MQQPTNNHTNYTQSELDKFNTIAPNWWDENGPLKTLHQVNPIRIKFILENLNQENLNKNNLENLNILDVGCGGGILSEGLAKLGAKVTGIDLSPNAIETAKKHAQPVNPQLNIDYKLVSIEDFANDKNNLNKFDVITCMELLEHVPDPAAILFNIKKLLNPNGLVFLSTLNRNPKSYLLAIVAAEYILNWIPRGTHEYKKFIKPSEMAKLLRQNNLNINKLAGITYSLLNTKFVITDDIDVNYMLCAS